MYTDVLRRCLAACLAVVLPVAFASAEGGSFIASGAGPVSINGKLMQGTQAIFAGDQISTAGGASAALTMPGATVNLAESTAVVFEEGIIRVNSGTARILSREMSATYNEVIVRPISKDGSQYLVGKVRGRDAIAALHGSVMVSDGTNTVVIHEGHALTRLDNLQAKQEPAPGVSGTGGEGKKKKEKPAAHDARAESAATGFALPGWAQVAIIGGTVGGVLGGLALAGNFSHPVSPTAP